MVAKLSRDGLILSLIDRFVRGAQAASRLAFGNDVQPRLGANLRPMPTGG